MPNQHLSRRTAIASIATMLSGAALADAFPSKPITIVVPFSVGGSTDIVARLVASQMASPFGPAIVENRVGASGVLGWNSVARAAPDGYTLITIEMSYAIATGLLTKLPFDTHKSFTQIVTAVQMPHVLVVNPSLPAKNVAELIALAKARPGKIFYGSGGNGTNTHLGAELFKDTAGNLDIVHVPYKGAGAVLADLMGGQVQMLITSLPTALPYIQSGKLRALMMASDKRSPLLPDVPSAPEVGLPKMDMKFWIGFAAPAGTPPAVIDALNKAVAASLQTPDSKKRLLDLGLEPIANTPQQAAKLVDGEMDRWAAVIKERGIKPD